MSVEIDLTDSVVLVTGASQGIGEATVRCFHGAGAAVVINHAGTVGTAADAERIAAELNGERAGSAEVEPADVSDAEAVRSMMERVRARSGGIDFLVNNAGILRDRTAAKMSLEDWQDVIDVNLSGVFHCCKYGLEIMREGGAIVSLGSISALLGFYGQANYAAAKAGVLALTRVLSREAARRGIRVNAIAPGVIDTAMVMTIPDEERAAMMRNIPLGRKGEAREVAEVALFLCSPLASYVTGQTIEVNGGWRG